MLSCLAVVLVAVILSALPQIRRSSSATASTWSRSTGVVVVMLPSCPKSFPFRTPLAVSNPLFIGHMLSAPHTTVVDPEDIAELFQQVSARFELGHNHLQSC